MRPPVPPDRRALGLGRARVRKCWPSVSLAPVDHSKCPPMSQRFARTRAKDCARRLFRKESVHVRGKRMHQRRCSFSGLQETLSRADCLDNCPNPQKDR